LIKNAIGKIKKEDITGSVDYDIIDLSSLDSVKKFAKKFNQEHER
jgi:hypothetical protein